MIDTRVFLDMTSILLAQDDYTEAQEQLENSAASLRAAITRVWNKSDAIEHKRAVAYQIYWENTNIPTTWIAIATGLNAYEIRMLAGIKKCYYTCSRCEQNSSVELTSRTMEQEITKKYCESCEEEIRRYSTTENQRIIAQREARYRELHTMPYREYLQTPEWKNKRYWRLREAEHRCQVCNGDGVLNVHHRTYIRRGYEYNRDLIVLCQNCHKTFHETGKLVKEPS